MNREKCLHLIAQIKEDIDKLPKGYISSKKIGDRLYFYHQWSEDGKKKSKYIKDEELASLSKQIERRKELQEKLKNLKTELAGISKISMVSTPHTKYNLMHKNTLVARLWLDNNSGYILNVEFIFDASHMPIGVTLKDGRIDQKRFNTWWTERSIPASRSGVKEALSALGVADTKSLLIKCYGLSLSDQYWICPLRSNLTWEKINFFNNDFSEDIGDALFGSAIKSNAIDFSSPDSTSDGNLKKRWKIIDGKRCLLKGGSNPYRQQPLNEVIATEIMKRLGIPHVNYTLTWNKGAPYCVCEDFVDENTELVSAWRITQSKKQTNDANIYQHLVKCAKSLGIKDVVPFLDRMIVLDYIILNEDRHLNNFGALRDAESLEWIGMAPIYDSGSSLDFDKTVALMKDKDEIICKPFKKTHEEQLKLVTDFSWIDFSALDDIGGVIRGVLSDKNAVDYIDERRIETICDLAQKRVNKLRIYAKKNQSKI